MKYCIILIYYNLKAEKVEVFKNTTTYHQIPDDKVEGKLYR